MRDYEPYYTEDGSIGLYSYADKDVYHSKFGALTEAWEKFILPSGIDNILNKKQDINVLDLCYGIGYNTKALMSCIIDKNFLYLKNKNIFSKVSSFVSIHTNKILKKINRKLSSHNEAIDDNNSNGESVHENDEKSFILSNINIDCMDINEQLVKLSPLFKTIKTPGEVYEKIVPEIFSCFDSYYKIKKLYENIAGVFYPKNRKEINELLEIKFKIMHIDKEYKVNELVNYILLNYMQMHYEKEYLDDEIKNILRKRPTSKFFSNSLIKYAKFNRLFGYNLSSGINLSTFLHNIYYATLSGRYKNINFKAAERLFNLHYYIDDARKSIKAINKAYDIVFLDAFTYTKAPILWSVEFIAELYKHLSEDGIILTYSNSAQIRNTFLENNLYVGKIYNNKTDKFIGTIASKNKMKIKYPLNNYELGLCNTTAGIPYHDPNLTFTSKEILELREYDFRHSTLMSSSKYMKIRSMRGDND